MLDFFAYFFETHPTTEFMYAPYAFTFIIGIFFLSFVFEYIRKTHMHDSLRKATRSISHVMRYSAIAALLMTWTRIVGIPYLSMRMWWIVLALFLMFWLGYVFYRYLDLEKKRKRFEGKVEKEDTRAKYLPKKKKK